jgi:hypothetical protein
MKMSPALSIKFPPVIWIPDAESKRGMVGVEEKEGDTAWTQHKIKRSCVLLLRSFHAKNEMALILQHRVYFSIEAQPIQSARRSETLLRAYSSLRSVLWALNNSAYDSIDKLLNQFTKVEKASRYNSMFICVSEYYQKLSTRPP